MEPGSIENQKSEMENVTPLDPSAFNRKPWFRGFNRRMGGLLVGGLLLALGLWTWQQARGECTAILKVDSIQIQPGYPPRGKIKVSIPAGEPFEKEAKAALETTKGLQLCGNFNATTIQFELNKADLIPRPDLGGIQLSSEGWQRMQGPWLFAAHWFRAADGTIRVSPEDPLELALPGGSPSLPDVADLWLEIRVPKRGSLRAMALLKRRSDGSWVPGLP